MGRREDGMVEVFSDEFMRAGQRALRLAGRDELALNSRALIDNGWVAEVGYGGITDGIVQVSSYS
jgi:hypothetical protein